MFSDVGKYGGINRLRSIRGDYEHNWDALYGQVNILYFVGDSYTCTIIIFIFITFEHYRYKLIS